MATPASVLGARLKVAFDQSYTFPGGTATWADDKALAGAAVQATGAKQPASSIAPSSLVALSFDGSADFVKSPGYASQPSERYICLFFVFKSTTNSGVKQVLWEEKDTLSGDNCSVYLNTAGKLVADLGTVTPGISDNVLAGDNTWHTVILYVDQFNIPIKLHVDGVLQATTGDKSGGDGIFAGSRGDIWFGISSDETTSPFAGLIAGVGYAYDTTDFISLVGSLHTALFDTYLAPAIVVSPLAIPFTANDVLLQRRIGGGQKLSVYFDDAATRWFDDAPIFQLDGAAAAGSYTLAVSAGSAPFSGKNVGLTVQRRLAVSAASIATTGQSVGLAVTMPVASATSAPFAGQAVALRAQRQLAISAASIALNAQAVGLNVTLPVTSTAIAFAAQNVGLSVQRRLAVSALAIGASGQAIALAVTMPVAAASAPFVGQNVTLTYTPAPGSYTLSVSTLAIPFASQAVGLSVQRRVTVTAAAIAMVSSQVGLALQHKVAVVASSVPWSGQNVGLSASRRLAVSAAGVAFGANAVGLAMQHRLAVAAETIAASGQSVGLRAQRKLSVAAGSVPLATVAVGLSRGWRLIVAAHAAAFSSGSVNLAASRRLSVDPIALVFAGQDVALDYVFAAPFPIGELTVTGFAPSGSVVVPENEATFRVAMSEEAEATVTENTDGVVVGNAA